MSPIQSILALILSDIDSQTYRWLFKNSVHLAGRLHANAHILAPSSEIPSLQKQVSEMAEKPIWKECSVVFHPLLNSIMDQLLQMIQNYDCELILTENKAEPNSSEHASLMQQILEKVPRPVFLLPTTLDFEVDPITSFLVPLSGEDRSSESLNLALSLSEQLKTPVDLIHVTPRDRTHTILQALESVRDEFQHEYPEIIERIVSEFSPYSSAKQRSLLRKFYQTTGITFQELAKFIETMSGGVIVIEWKGTLLKGHADIVKNLILEKKFPLLLVKVKRQMKSKLKAGPDFQAD